MDQFEERLKNVRLPQPSKRLDERVLGQRIKLNLLPSLLPGETVLLSKSRVWLGSIKAIPNYRVFFTLPPLCEVGLYVTDRRILLIAHVLRLVTFEFSQWLYGIADGAEDDIVQRTRSGRNLFGLPFVEVESHACTKRWWRSSKLRLRLYVRDPQSIERLIAVPDPH